MRRVVEDMLFALHTVPRKQRAEPLLAAMRRAHAALAGTLPPEPNIAPESALQLLRSALDYCHQAGVANSDIVIAVNANNRRAAGEAREAMQ
ncbi:hypothetical protein [Ferrovibrio sp.]|uniref:hypothetical protein n=1 Tax=Ferrovibrio sp. TaxID=1917215 RepID=UPI0025C3954C|nr:hypothetical protein [Ferrovibrio sp.]MBX3455805.1 hypothetical protein [Ferrovibrio sp.]